MIKELQERLIKGFSRFGYALHASDSGEVNNEFRKSETALRFVVMPAEGGVILLSTESPVHDLLNSTLRETLRDLRQEVDIQSFCGSPDEFWQAVEEIIKKKSEEA